MQRVVMDLMVFLLVFSLPIMVQVYASMPTKQLQQHVSSFITAYKRNMMRTELYSKKNTKRVDGGGKVNSVGNTKQQSIASVAQLSTASEAPLRITNQLNIPVRQQIAWAKARKRLNKQTSSSITGKVKKFRRDKSDSASNTTTTDLMEDLDAVDYMNIKPPAIFVDGYNIIGVMKSSSTSSQFGGDKVDFEGARESLISDLCMLRTATGWWIELVFDAYKTGASQSSTSTDNIIVTYTSASDTADTFIERRFQELSNEGFTNMVVATDDNVLRMVAGSNGAGYISANMLLDELRIAYRGWDTVATQLDVEARRHKPTIASSMSDEFKAAMEQMTMQAKRCGGDTARVDSSDNHVLNVTNSFVDIASSRSTTVEESCATVVSQPLIHSTKSTVQQITDQSKTSGALSIIDEIEIEINSKYGYATPNRHGSSWSMGVTDRSLSDSKSTNHSSSPCHGNVIEPTVSKNAVAPRRKTTTINKNNPTIAGSVFRPTVGLGASAELRQAYDLLLKQQKIKDKD